MIGTLIVCWFAGSLVAGGLFAVNNLRADRSQQQPDENADWLGADAGGSFNHHEDHVA